MTDAEIREVGRLAGLLDGLQSSLDDKHAENRSRNIGLSQQIAEHDKRDQDFFAEIFRRLAPLETRDQVEDRLALAKSAATKHRHDWLLTAATVFGMALAAATGSLLTIILSHGGHP